MIIGELGEKSTGILQEEVGAEPAEIHRKKRVCGFIDGFNFYHALDLFQPAIPVSDPDRYRKYKWIDFTALLQKYIRHRTEVLSTVTYFTAYPTWKNSEEKRRRHAIFVAAQEQMGVQVTFGEFKPKQTKCQSLCRQVFTTYVEKQTDINIAVAMIHSVDCYDKAILLTADSDQVPVIKLLKTLYPSKRFANLPPIGRGAKDLGRVCHEQFKMTEAHLAACQLAIPLPVIREGKPTGAYLVKPSQWP